MLSFPFREKIAKSERMVAEMETLGGSLEDVRAFCAVLEFGTITAAARAVGETKGSISRRISRLERRLEVRLLARTPRAVSPTEEGLAFHTRAREALSWLDDAVEGARGSRSTPHGHLRVTAPIDLGMDVLPNLVVQFRALHPQISVDLLITDATLDLASHRIDLALRATTGALPDSDYRASPIADFRLALYAAPGYLDQHGRPTAPAELATHDLIASRGEAGAVEWIFTDGGGRSEAVIARPRLRTSDYASALRLATAGGGIAAVPDRVAAGAAAAGTLEPVLTAWQLAHGRIYALSLGGRDAPARVDVFRRFIREALA